MIVNEVFLMTFYFYWHIRSQCTVYLPPENSYGFLMFLGVRESVHWVKYARVTRIWEIFKEFKRKSYLFLLNIRDSFSKYFCTVVLTLTIRALTWYFYNVSKGVFIRLRSRLLSITFVGINYWRPRKTREHVCCVVTTLMSP